MECSGLGSVLRSRRRAPQPSPRDGVSWPAASAQHPGLCSPRTRTAAISPDLIMSVPSLRAGAGLGTGCLLLSQDTVTLLACGALFQGLILFLNQDLHLDFLTPCLPDGGCRGRRFQPSRPWPQIWPWALGGVPILQTGVGDMHPRGCDKEQSWAFPSLPASSPAFLPPCFKLPL